MDKCAVTGCGQVPFNKRLCVIHAHEFLDALEEGNAEEWTIEHINPQEERPRSS